MVQLKTADQLLKHKLWMDSIVAKQESYLKDVAEVKAKELIARQFDGVKAIELLIEQEKAKKDLQSRTADKTIQ